MCDNEVAIEEGSTNDPTAVDVEGSSPPTFEVVLGVKSLMKEFDSGVIVEEADVEASEVGTVVVGVLV